jgi:Glycosyl transferase family 2
MIFLNVRKIFSLVVFIIVFALFWMSIFLYVSTWDSNLLKELKQKGLITQNLLKQRTGIALDHLSPSSSKFFRKKIMRNEKYRKLFGLQNPGENGEPVKLPEKLSDDVMKLIEEGQKSYTINEFVSELISLRRTLPDIRDDYCKNQTYINLPKASVIIIFHNEAWSMVLRTMHSVLDRSPDELLEEIIFVDDCSDRGSKMGRTSC